MAYEPENNLRKLRRSRVYSGTGVQITATGTALDVNAVIIPGPGGLNDYFSAEVDETGAPLNPIPAAALPIILPFIDLSTLLPFVSQAVIFENLSPVDLWISFDAGDVLGTYHRIRPGRSVAMDALGAASIAILDPSGVGGQQYNVNAWG